MQAKHLNLGKMQTNLIITIRYRVVIHYSTERRDMLFYINDAEFEFSKKEVGVLTSFIKYLKYTEFQFFHLCKGNLS